jgi:hypothetical protein
LSIGLNSSNLTFAASSNCSNTIEWRASLTAQTAWNELPNNLTCPGPIRIPFAKNGTNRFFRLNALRKQIPNCAPHGSRKLKSVFIRGCRSAQFEWIAR